MQIPEPLKKLEDAGVSLLVLVVCSIAAAVFYFTSVRPSLAEHERWDKPGMICSNESIGPRGGLKLLPSMDQFSECSTFFSLKAEGPDFPGCMGSTICVMGRQEKWESVKDLQCSGPEFERETQLKDLVKAQFPSLIYSPQRFDPNPQSEYFGGHLTPMDDISRYSKLPDTDPFLDSPKFIKFFSGTYFSVNKDSRGFYLDTGSRVLDSEEPRIWTFRADRRILSKF